MGVKNFFKILISNIKSRLFGQTIGDFGCPVTLKGLQGIYVCIDASIMIYSSMTAFAGLNDPNTGEATTHLNTILNKVIQLAGMKMKQVWIFDSPQSHEMKAHELARRAQTREASGQYKLQTKHIEEVKQMLRNLDVLIIEAPPRVEAEQYGAFLTQGAVDERFCRYMLSGDSDVLMFGGNLLRVYTERTATGKSKKQTFRIYELEDLLATLDLTLEQFRIMGVTMGTDFNAKTAGIGERTVLEAVKTGKCTLNEEQKKALAYYSTTITVAQAEEAKIEQGVFGRDQLIEMLAARGFNAARISKRLADYQASLS